jgi:hexosaminidase
MRITKYVYLTCTLLLLSACDIAQKTPETSALLKQATQSDIDLIARNLDIKYRLITNEPTDKCDQSKGDGHCFEVELSLTATAPILAKDWSIHFSQVAPVQSFESDEFLLQHINGDLHKIDLSPAYQGFEQGETKTILFRAIFWSLSETDAMPNYIVVSNNTQPKVISSTQTTIDPDTGLELLPYVLPYTNAVKQFKRTSDDSTQWLNSKSLFARNIANANAEFDVAKMIVPTPKKMMLDQQNRVLSLANGLAIDFGNVPENEVSAALTRLASFGFATNAKGTALKLNISADSSKMAGSYQLLIDSQAISITGVDGNGVFNGLQSLASLVRLDSTEVPLLEIDDEPLYQFRGMMVDVARNFHSKAFIFKLLDQMAAYKLNKLHLHLGDDEGWRLEIPGLPELTQLSSKRCFDLQEQQCLMPQLGAGIDPKGPVSGYYSVTDYQEILQAASARHIQVIPSLDMPGHSRAAIKAMQARAKKYAAQEQTAKAQQFQLVDNNDQTKYSSVQFYNDNTINVCLETSYAFVTEVMTQVKAMHQQVGHALTRYHIGADETAGAWIESPACIDFIANNNQGVKDMSELGAYFVERVAKILSKLDIETAGWSDGLSHTRVEKMPAVVQVNAWGVLPWGGHSQTHDLANRNWQVVVSTPDVLYFDFPYEADPKEHGYYWASRQVNTEKIFQFMPGNLPVHAEFWLDRQDNPFVADDRPTFDEQGKLTSGPLQQGRQFLGVQGQLWSENTRTDSMAEHKVFPRLLALAERAWHLPQWAVPYNYEGFKYSRKSKVFSDQLKASRDLQWQQFATNLGSKEFAKLDHAGIAYRLPTVGASIVQGVLSANSAFPGLSIEFKQQGRQWQDYSKPVSVSEKVAVRSISPDRKRRGRTTFVVE